MITQEYVRERLDYNEDTGSVRWRYMPHYRQEWNTRYAGKEAGSVRVDGYKKIAIDGEQYLLHQIVYFYVTGKWTDYVDHKDTEKGNLKWSNIRAATKSQNGANRGAQKNNPLGLKGVSWSKPMNMYRARICVNRKQMQIMYSSCPAAAHFAYAIEADKHFGEFARSS
jgi:HNH endonuclease